MKQSQFTQADYDSLNELKKNINLVDLACHKFGYIPDWQYVNSKGQPKEVKSSANFIRLIHKDDPLDIVLVSKQKETGYYRFKSMLNDDDKGTIIDFAKYRFKDFTISNFRKYCKNYQSACAAAIFTPIDTSRHSKIYTPRQEYYLNPSNSNLKKLTDVSYLTQRGFTASVATGCFKNAYNLLEQNGSTSLVLPFYKTEVLPDKTVNLRLQTYQKYSDTNTIKKQFFAGAKENAVWIGNFKQTQTASALVFSESPIDAGSLAVLKPELVGANPVLTASGGDLPYAIHKTYDDLAKLLSYPPIILANDNDCKGQQFNAKLLSSLDFKNYCDDDFYQSNKAFDDVVVSCGLSEKKGYLEFNFSHAFLNKDTDTLEKGLPVFTNVRDYFLQLNHDLDNLYGKDKGDVFQMDVQFGGHKSSIDIKFQNIKENWEYVNESLLFLRYGNSEKIEIQKSVFKDFNDDLKVLKGCDYKALYEQKDLVKEFSKVYQIDETKLQKVIDKDQVQNKGIKL